MDLNDVAPVFNLFFLYILPSIFMLLFLAILYKLIVKFGKKIRKLLEMGKREKKSSFAEKAFYDFVDFIFMDGMVAFVIVVPMMLMIINFLAQNSLFMLEHFWDYTYPALTVIMVITALKIWTNVIRRVREVFR